MAENLIQLILLIYKKLSLLYGILKMEDVLNKYGGKVVRYVLGVLLYVYGINYIRGNTSFSRELL
ncbi:hypothetical protein acsn021_37970 [Anaerocolumna cellulosilytica]|uniref:Uncharacterized protein n=1 Tax=Anaerocolumna cellulosilytica TaxID=433286 RepID=A0A6S6RBF6_9FIRM|nr:hypothetical protein acsn021_37970 [Anaerocolumna cellulosilytica]